VSTFVLKVPGKHISLLCLGKFLVKVFCPCLKFFFFEKRKETGWEFTKLLSTSEGPRLILSMVSLYVSKNINKWLK